VTEQASAPLTILSTPDAAVCEGDACLIPGMPSTEHPEHAIVARRLDDDLV
jgi:hypothetical protein